MRRFWIHQILPILFCLIPILGAGLILAAIPAAARLDYYRRLQDSHIDWVILGLGSVLFTAQIIFTWKSFRWRDDPPTGFDERPDQWLSLLAQAAEWFPLLGLIGTVAAILQTFGSFAPGTRPSSEEIIQKYGPAITATGSGLFMALLNILPSWIVIAGRKIIISLTGSVVPLTQVGQGESR